MEQTSRSHGLPSYSFLFLLSHSSSASPSSSSASSSSGLSVPLGKPRSTRGGSRPDGATTSLVLLIYSPSLWSVVASQIGRPLRGHGAMTTTTTRMSWNFCGSVSLDETKDAMIADRMNVGVKETLRLSRGHARNARACRPMTVVLSVEFCC